MTQEIRVRLAPSPTGNLHVGTAQSALYNWLFAKKNDGKFFLRIEDTDRERSTKEYEASILDSLTWLGLNWDREVIRQSERKQKYREVLDKLEKAGKLEITTLTYTPEEKEQLLKDGKKISSKIYAIPIDVVSSVPVIFHDIIRGDISVERKHIGPSLIIARVPEEKPDEITFLYNFAVVVDDIDMEITHVIRGEDHISNTPKQILIYETLGEEIPKFAHLPLILAADRSKLSKRHGATAVVDYKDDYLPEALINFLGKLSYTFSTDVTDCNSMIKEFDLSQVHHSGAVFDSKKLDWINGEYIKKLNDKELIEKLQSHLGEQEGGIITRILPMVRERIKKFSDIKEFEFFFKEPEYDGELLIWKTKSQEEISNSLQAVADILEKFDENIDKERLKKELDELSVIISSDPAKSSDDRGASRGLIYWPFRVALTGQKASPDPVDVAEILGKNETLKRIDKAFVKLRAK